jgi:Na+/H+ antiporter NhaD/arsenite permease-like protein
VDLWKDRFKELLSTLISAAVSAGAWQWSSKMLPFINPQIPADLGLVSLFVAIFVAYFICAYSREPRPPSPPSKSSKALAFTGLAAAIIGLVVMVFLSQQVVPLDPNLEALAIRLAYLSFVIGLGAPLGWGISRM